MCIYIYIYVRHFESLLYMYIHMITHVYVDVIFPFVSHSSFQKKISHRIISNDYYSSGTKRTHQLGSTSNQFDLVFFTQSLCEFSHLLAVFPKIYPPFFRPYPSTAPADKKTVPSQFAPTKEQSGGWEADDLHKLGFDQRFCWDVGNILETH